VTRQPATGLNLVSVGLRTRGKIHDFTLCDRLLENTRFEEVSWT